MKAIYVLSVALACVVNATADDDIPPPNQPPQLWRASATEKDGKVIVQIDRPVYKTPRKAEDREAMKWRKLEKVAVGDSLHAFDVDGKRLKPKDVLTALRQPTAVAVFVRFYEPLLEPDPFYLAVLREGTIIFVVVADAIADPIP